MPIFQGAASFYTDFNDVSYSNCRYIVLDSPFLLAEDPVVGGYKGKQHYKRHVCENDLFTSDFHVWF